MSLYFNSTSKSRALRSSLKRLDLLMDWERCLRSPGQNSRMRVTCESTKELVARLGFPNKQFKAVHITGSKGKGSVGILISTALRHAPFTSGPIGTYGSPHVEAINERIRLNGVPVSDDTLGHSLARVLDVREQAPVIEGATWFDVLSSTAMHAFQEARVEWAVVEVGMGGRLDSTNVLSAPVSVITNIHMEHAEVIGPTLKDIAYEKAGIIAPGADVILGMPLDHHLAPIFLREARMQVPPAKIQAVHALHHSISERNVLLARSALESIAAREGSSLTGEELLPDDLARSALAYIPARQEIFSVGPVTVLLDGAHVPESVAQILTEARNDKEPIIVVGMGKEKDVPGICQVIMRENPLHVFATVAGVSVQYLPADQLAESFRQLGLEHVTESEDAIHALHSAIDMARKTDSLVIVVGSLHVAGKVRPELRRLAEQHRTSNTKLQDVT